MTEATVTLTSPYPPRITEEVFEAARGVPGGWVYVVDPQANPDSSVPETATMGAWAVDGEGRPTGEFRENLRYRPSPVALGRRFKDDLDKVVQLYAARYATRDDVAITVLFAEVEFPATGDGAPAVLPGDPLPVYGSSSDRAAKPALPAGTRWRRALGHELALQLPDDATVAVSPGRWQIELTGSELFARAAANASGEMLLEAIAELARGGLDMEAFQSVFAAAHVFFEAPATPGFVAREIDGTPVVAVFTSLVELARFAGQTSWASTIGHDVLGLLPEGHDLVLDPGSEHALRLRAAALAPRQPGRRD